LLERFTMFALTIAALSSVQPKTLDPLALLQDKAAQATRLRPYAPPPGLETATLALG